MRPWSKWTAPLLAVVLSALILWPFLGLYQLAAAVRAVDASRLLDRVEVASVRRSVVDQAVAEVMRGADVRRRLGPLAGQLTRGASIALDQQLAGLINADAIRDLLQDRVPPALTKPGQPDTAATLDWPRAPIRYLHGAWYGAPTTFRVRLGASPSEDAWLTLTFRRRGLEWKLTELHLPQALMSHIIPLVQAKMGFAS
jgi:hypothetical protein